ncbi:hypothetical protein [Echinicola vietnamensis]|uniref:Uncharacterized protein n=1 Tax=Echinicola vietnamensis (strain DSM 17526 / LMG 23754 / KMM 6221) TaxID=926556 RepID=L0G4Y3_ECHVK|nr:hypothetical protein [Echinicola vietnamensis]AGA79890.1 hypothetical protein Echvi_3676 [Echinicola vietnamensis DSM 17526]
MEPIRFWCVFTPNSNVIARQSISLTKPNGEWLKAQVDNKEYSRKSELVNGLIRMYHDGVEKLGITQADKYFDIIAERLFFLLISSLYRKGI